MGQLLDDRTRALSNIIAEPNGAQRCLFSEQRKSSTPVSGGRKCTKEGDGAGEEGQHRTSETLQKMPSNRKGVVWFRKRSRRPCNEKFWSPSVEGHSHQFIYSESNDIGLKGHSKMSECSSLALSLSLSLFLVFSLPCPISQPYQQILSADSHRMGLSEREHTNLFGRTKKRNLSNTNSWSQKKNKKRRVPSFRCP